MCAQDQYQYLRSPWCRAKHSHTRRKGPSSGEWEGGFAILFVAACKSDKNAVNTATWDDVAVAVAVEEAHVWIIEAPAVEFDVDVDVEGSLASTWVSSKAR